MNYDEYMDSKEWEELRELASKRANKRCEFCTAPGHSVHHVKYPKSFSEDELDNVVVVCKKCHELSHGIRRGEVRHLGSITDCILDAMERKQRFKDSR